MNAVAEVNRLLSVIARTEADLDRHRREEAAGHPYGRLNAQIKAQNLATSRAELAAVTGQAPAANGGSVDAGWDRAGRQAYGDRWKGPQGGQAAQALTTFRQPAAPASVTAIDAGWDRAGRQAFGDQWRGLDA